MKTPSTRSDEALVPACVLLVLALVLPPSLAQVMGPEFQVNTYTTSDQRNPAVAADGSGNLVVAWQSRELGTYDHSIFGQRFDSSGDALGSEFQVNTFTTNFQWFPALAVHGAGYFVVAWQDIALGGDGQDGSGNGIFAAQSLEPLSFHIFSDGFESGTTSAWSASGP